MGATAKERIMEFAKSDIKRQSSNVRRCSLCDDRIFVEPTAEIKAVRIVRTIFGEDLAICERCADVLANEITERFRRDMIGSLLHSSSRLKRVPCIRCGGKLFLFDLHYVENPFGCPDCGLLVEYNVWSKHSIDAFDCWDLEGPELTYLNKYIALNSDD